MSYAEDQIAIQVRTENNGAWSRWTKVEYHDDHGPDGGSSEEESATERPGTDALVIGDVDQRADARRDHRRQHPARPEARDHRPGHRQDDQAGARRSTPPSCPSPQARGRAGDEPQASGVTTLEGDGTSDDVTLSAMKRPAKPTIYSRAQWGANEKMREQSPPSYGTVKTGFIHHTVNANNYTAAQVPALLRGIYAYHTQSRGWRDIGYNYLVDRFGRIWEGRYGGVNRAVVGAHTLGYNEVSFAMSAIGNFDIARPPPAVRRRLRAAVRLEAVDLQHPRQQPADLRQGPLPARDQRPPRRRADRVSGPIPLREDPLHPEPGPRDPARGAEGRRRQLGTDPNRPHAASGDTVHLADPDPACGQPRSRRSPSRSRRTSPARRTPTSC